MPTYGFVPFFRASLGGVGLLLVLVMLGCEPTPKKEDPSLTIVRDSFPVDPSRDIIIDMDGKLLEDNKLVMKYTSPLVFSTQKGDSAWIEFKGGIKGDFYDAQSSSNQKTGYMEAKYAIYYRKLKKMYLKGNVKIINDKNDVLRSDDLWWNQRDRNVYTDGRISFVQDGSKLYGVGFKSTQDMSEYEVKQLTGKIAEDGF